MQPEDKFLKYTIITALCFTLCLFIIAALVSIHDASCKLEAIERMIACKEMKNMASLIDSIPVMMMECD